jgi:regulator of protease activity HflC (stomatin/prohibitin superfamily)
MAQAEAEAIQKIAGALPEGQAAMYLLGMKYLEALPTLAQGKNSTIFLPAEAAGVMGAIGGLRELVSRAAAPTLHTQADTPVRVNPQLPPDIPPKDSK